MVDADGASRDGVDRLNGAFLAQPHDRSFAKLLFDLPDGQLDRLQPFTVQALVSTIEASDTYTRGHSERVTRYSLVLARYLGLEAAAVKRLEQAAILHDIGKIGIDTAIPCGLIVHELVANALKHAFPDKGQGEIQLKLRARHDGQFVLRVGDNGVGFPLDVDFRRVDSLGLKLVNMLTQQLDGVIELERHEGTTFTITFPELKYQKRA